MPLHERLKAARVAGGHSVASAFARQIGVEPNTVYRIERGDLKPSIDTLKAWATACGVTADSLLGIGEDSSTPPSADQPRAEVNTVEPAA